MVQFRRLDPLANAGPWQRATKRGIKSFTLSQEQYDRVSERRPQLIISEEDGVVLCRPYRDFLEVHYAYAEVPAFRDNFKPMLKSALSASSRDEAPRGVVLAFRDRPNRPIAAQLFWEATLEESKHWMEARVHLRPGDGPAVRPARARLHGARGDRRRPRSRRHGRGRSHRLPAPHRSRPGRPLRERPLALRGQRRLRPRCRRRRHAPRRLLGHHRWHLHPPGAGTPCESPSPQWTLRSCATTVAAASAVASTSKTTSSCRCCGASVTRPARAASTTCAPCRTHIQEKVEERKSHGTIIKFGNWR